ncbi:tudor domain-containing protein 15 [Eleginops maclovinus]|uniref:tudor domain-containing protein 15 n=1 Tax=Eleginops maclovinus TaxID=56733 RepID=UPI00308053D6
MQHVVAMSCIKRSGQSALSALWSVDLELTHLNWNPEATLIHFQGQYLTICDLDYNILQWEIQNIPKSQAAVDIGEFCLVEDLTSGSWYRGRVQNREEDIFDVFLIDHEADRLWKVEIVKNRLFLRHITTSLQQNKEMVSSSPADTKEEGQSNLDSSPPQQLVFPSIDLYKEYSGFATAVTTPMEFCVVLEDLLLVMNQVSIILEDLPEQMSPLPEAHIVPGTCCLYKSDTKNKWCRAEIVNIDTTAVLDLVDYGHYECIPYEECSQLKRLPEDLTNPPKVTFPCVLRGVKPVGEDSSQWSDEAAFFFHQCFYQKNLLISFRELVSNTHWKVDILADGVNVAKELVDAGYADYTDIILGETYSHKAAPRCPKSEVDVGPEDEGSDGKSDLLVESTDEAEREMPLSLVCRSQKCFRF